MISEVDIDWWCSLHLAYGFGDVRRVCDFGQQEIRWLGDPALLAILGKFADICGVPDALLVKSRTSVELWRMLKREIVSIDVCGNGDDLRRIDLNADPIPADLVDSFDLVTNIGTSEHIINQMAVFRAMHDLTKRNAVMVHAIPCGGYSEHGLFNYNAKFFTLLAKYNDYHCIDAMMRVGSPEPLAPDVAEFLADAHGMFKNARSQPRHFAGMHTSFRATDAGLFVALRKMTDAPFRAPLDATDEAHRQK